MEVIFREFCPACGTDDKEIIFSPTDDTRKRFLHLSSTKYQSFMDGWEKLLTLEIQRCRRCAHFWHRSQPDQDSLFGMYRSALPLNRRDPSREPSPLMIRTMLRLYKLLKLNKIHKPNLLDYGSGGGRWSQAAARAGFNVYAYEPVGTRSAAVRENDSVIVVHKFDNVKDQKFDLINLEQVIEHIINPLEILQSLKSMCHSKTLVRITVPNLTRCAESFWESFPFDGKRIHLMSPYEHLHGFSSRSLDALLGRAGYKREYGITVWLTHPVYLGRYIAGRLFQRFGITTALVRCGNDDHQGRLKRNLHGYV